MVEETKNIIISTNVDNECCDIVAIRTSFDESKREQKKHWITELLINNELINSINSYNNIVHSTEAQKSVRNNIVSKLALSEDEANKITDQLINIATLGTKSRDIIKLDPTKKFEERTSQQQPSSGTNPELDTRDEVQLFVKYFDHIIQVITQWNGKLFSTRYFKDGKDPLSVNHKTELYFKEKSRDDDVRVWLKRKFDISQKKYADDIINDIREKAESLRQSIDNMKNNPENKKIVVPGYENYELVTVTEKGSIILNTNEVVRSIIEKFSIISYKKSIWEYRNGIYVQDDSQVHEESQKFINVLASVDL